VTTRNPAARIAALAAAAALLGSAAAAAQEIRVDRGVRAAGLYCFPSATRDTDWYYVPQTARLVTDEKGKPAFSYLRFVVNRPSEAGGSKGITRGEGGGLLTFAATYDTPPDLIDEAQLELRQIIRDGDAVLRGPVTFKEGRYVLVSSLLREGRDPEHLMLASGNAPVFEGNPLPFSFEVGPEDSKKLLESFEMATPDVSLQYEMIFTGLTDAYDAELFVDWDEVDKNETLKAGVDLGPQGVATVGASIEKGFRELHESGAIKLTARGADGRMDALLEKVHARLLDLMFEKAPQHRGEAPDPMSGEMGAMLQQMQRQAAASSGSAIPTYVTLTAKYHRRTFKRTGQATLRFNAESPRDVNTSFVMNIGSLYKKYGDDPSFFRTVNLSDAAFQQREIHVGIDGAILPEFERYVNSVAVTLRKTHQNGEQTLQEVSIERDTVRKEGADLRMIYGWQGDDDRDRWLEYEYRTRWSFKDGGRYETPWTRGTANMIDLFAPYLRTKVELLGDAEALAAQGVRAVDVVVEYPFFGETRTQEVTVATDEGIDGQGVEITLPEGVTKYDYAITWIRRDAEPLEASGSDDSGFIVVDELPATE
jgi:hypothetical protein